MSNYTDSRGRTYDVTDRIRFRDEHLMNAMWAAGRKAESAQDESERLRQTEIARTLRAEAQRRELV